MGNPRVFECVGREEDNWWLMNWVRLSRMDLIGAVLSDFHIYPFFWKPIYMSSITHVQITIRGDLEQAFCSNIVLDTDSIEEDSIFLGS